MKRWSKKDEEMLFKLLKDGFTYLDISIKLNRTKKSVKIKSSKLGLYFNDFKKSNKKIKCLNCGKEIEISLYNKKNLNRKFCSSSCSAIFNNKKRKKIKNCDCCGVELKNRQKKYCSNKCQNNYYYLEYIKEWKNDNINVGEYKVNTSSHIRQYSFEKYNNKCSKCGWGEVNKFTGNIPLEIEHIDGDSSNNKEDNLTLLCPNCHSLTKTYKGANRGNGRHERRKRYKEGKSY